MVPGKNSNAAELSTKRVAQTDWPQSVHWNWAYKAATSSPSRFESFGDARLFGIEAKGQWQGVFFGLSEGHSTRLGAPDRPLVYIDFLESSPWNWEVANLNRVGRYRGVGLQLMELAVRWSLSLEYEGRIGLHALPQAEAFYGRRCRMNNLGIDPGYHGLCYFELAESDSEIFLGK